MRWNSRLLAVTLVAIFSGAALAQEKSVNPGINKPFENADVKEFTKRFEADDREVFVQRSAIVAALGLRPGMAVADIGAGTGIFTRLIADGVGSTGKVYAADISPAFLAHIAAESKKRGQLQLQTVRCSQEGVNLPPASIDLAFLCDVYHHLEYPSKTLASIHRALKPGGALVVVEFDRREGVSKPFVLEHVRASKEVFLGEIEAAGFERESDAATPALKENFFMRFRKKAEPAEAAPKPGGPAL
ncbi:MAG TPA: methyltransferase domain-containing protein [Isosphaeraceae bacterium]|nr:methyltransferase domain-containing protein [Isosphaeraceae bacterium]